jgi:hypothetical protein
LEEARKAVSATTVVCLLPEAGHAGTDTVPTSKMEIKVAAIVFRVFI